MSWRQKYDDLQTLIAVFAADQPVYEVAKAELGQLLAWLQDKAATEPEDDQKRPPAYCSTPTLETLQGTTLLVGCSERSPTRSTAI